MRLRVHCQEWVLGDRGHGVAVGDPFSEWLVLHGPEGWPAELSRTYEGLVTPLPPWEGLGLHQHAHRLDIGPAPVYWESPGRVQAGATTATGVLGLDTYLAPPDWPTTTGIVARMWTVHRWYVQDPPGSRVWGPESSDARYEEVSSCGHNLDGGREPHTVRHEVCTGVLLEVDLEPAR
ncbi:hypothetical protein [Serinicoccus kebangsaanensis]|uniref:hypothetical protein n=1 Tax=Serinicoccus kebangsaanensis TaxID=2602069 RepID=UPI00192D763A|nr:hypothetical protein [Serinicoccus kebangsaanensis]